MMKSAAGVWLVVFAALLSSCKQKQDERAAVAEQRSDPEELKVCVGALGAASRTNGDKLQILASGCAAVCSGLSSFADARRARPLDEEALWTALNSCGLSCSESSTGSELAIAERLSELARRCPAGHFGLPDGYLDHLSEDTVIASRIGQWLQNQRNQMSAGLLADFDRFTQHLHLPLPPPVSIDGRYQLPNSEAAQHWSSSFYLIVGSGGTSAAAVPVARLRGSPLELRPVPGGRPPGQPLPEGHEAETLAGLVELWRSHHHGEQAPSFTYLVDQTVTAERLVEMARRLGHRRFRLAVTGLSAREHPVEVVLQSANAAPVVVLEDGELRVLDREPGDVVADLRAALVQMAPANLVELRCAADTSVAEVVRALDHLASARAQRAALVSSAR
jgi:hypothetical protein